MKRLRSHLRVPKSSTFDPGTPPANTVLPAITGTAQVGQTLTSSQGTWTGTATITYAYQWQTSDNGTTGWTNIGGATSSTYLIDVAYLSKYLRCVVTGNNAAGSASASSSATTQVAAAGGATTTWNASDKTSNVTLSGGNLTVTTTGTADEQVRTVASRSSGKYYCEILYVTSPSGNGLSVGIASGTFTLGSNYLGAADTEAYVGLWTSATTRNWFKNNALGGDWTNITPSGGNKWIGIAVDLDNMKIWGKNITDGGGWGPSGTDDPATNTGGVSLSGYTGAPYHFILNTEFACTTTANFGGSAFQATAPSGFGNW